MPARVLAEIRRHAEATYPEECCGFLIGNGRPTAPEILRAEPASNAQREERGRRYVIPAADWARREGALEGSGESMLGFYHSHPDHTALPSAFDEENAWPGYLYLVLAVPGGSPGGFGAFELDAERRKFRAVPLEVRAPASGAR